MLLASRFPPLAYSITFCSSHLFLAAFFQAVWRAKWLRAGTSRRSSHGPLHISPPMILLSSSRLIFWSLDVELGTLPLGTVVCFPGRPSSSRSWQFALGLGLALALMEQGDSTLQVVPSGLFSQLSCSSVSRDRSALWKLQCHQYLDCVADHVSLLSENSPPARWLGGLPTCAQLLMWHLASPGPCQSLLVSTRLCYLESLKTGRALELDEDLQGE